ncbi:GH43 family beta-xylosidase [Alicyclobacillus sacchari]|uniref:GH43 family beta-xylosidase n=3 Tax=Alicyclobacillus sacchari TaxID=392010 RepID=A0A4R8LSQ2_9BACL|nr:GH43 family beta-xylosidase [Alicyclobacillus sacchari]
MIPLKLMTLATSISLAIVAIETSSATSKVLSLHTGQVASSFYNPIMNENADPWMIKWDAKYYLTATTGDNITLWSSNSITNIATGLQKTVWSPSGARSNFQDIWSPEIYHLYHRWYVYFSADKNGSNKTHRDYVLQSVSDSPWGPYKFAGNINSLNSQWMIDPTILTLRGHLYLLWSGWEDAKNQIQCLYIAPMSSPTQVSGSGVMISSPTYSWETSIAPINEGPVVLQHNGHVFVIYSANASWTNSYCLGMLKLTGNDPLQPKAWVKSPRPVFTSANGVYGPGRASFVTSEDGKQYWMIYNAARYYDSGWDRTIRAQPFTWNRNGTPNFGTPMSLNTAIPLPSGEKPNRLNYSPLQEQGHSVFYVNVPRAGTYGLYLRYKNATGATTTQSVDVNGHPQLPITFPPAGNTSGGTPDSVLDSFITLPKGRSKIQISTNSYTSAILQLQLTLTPVPLSADEESSSQLSK